MEEAPAADSAESERAVAAEAAPEAQPVESLLEDEAASLTPLFNSWHQMYQNGELAPYDFVGAYILAYLAYRNRHSIRGCICSRMIPPVLTEQAEQAAVSARIDAVPGLSELLGGAQYLARWVEDAGAITVVGLYSRARVKGIKKHRFCSLWMPLSQALCTV